MSKNEQFINSFKFKLVRIIEANPIINLIIYNNISLFKLFLPHEKIIMVSDY